LTARQQNKNSNKTTPSMGCFFSGDFLLALKLLKSYDKNMAEVKIVKM
jgi:hypothetical protein